MASRSWCWTKRVGSDHSRAGERRGDVLVRSSRAGRGTQQAPSTPRRMNGGGKVRALDADGARAATPTEPALVAIAHRLALSGRGFLRGDERWLIPGVLRGADEGEHRDEESDEAGGHRPQQCAPLARGSDRISKDEVGRSGAAGSAHEHQLEELAHGAGRGAERTLGIFSRTPSPSRIGSVTTIVSTLDEPLFEQASATAGFAPARSCRAW